MLDDPLAAHFAYTSCRTRSFPLLALFDVIVPTAPFQPIDSLSIDQLTAGHLSSVPLGAVTAN